MADRISAFVVVLEENLHADDAESTLNALRQIKGVSAVEPHVSDFSEEIARIRLRTELWDKIRKVLLS